MTRIEIVEVNAIGQIIEKEIVEINGSKLLAYAFAENVVDTLIAEGGKGYFRIVKEM